MSETVFPRGHGQGRNPYDPGRYPDVTYRVMQDGKSTLMLPHQDGDTYVVRTYPGERTVSERATGWETAALLRTLSVGAGYEIIHLRAGEEIARYWPMTVSDCAGRRFSGQPEFQ
jgi:hypothetical protein